MGHNSKKKKRDKTKQHNKLSIQNDEGERLENIEDIPSHSDLEITENSQKRQYDDNDSDHEEDKPRKKKKKKQLVAEHTPDKKGKKSIRQMKREKHMERQAAAKAVSKDQFRNECLSYLSQWKHDKQNWKFMKVKQIWLLKNKFSSTLLPDSTWPVLLEYFDSAQGNIRKILLEDANKIIKQMDEWTESQSDQNQGDTNNEEEANDYDNSDKTSTNVKPSEIVYKRARDLIQCLEE